MITSLYIKLKSECCIHKKTIFFFTIFMFLAVFTVIEHQQKIFANYSILKFKEQDLQPNIIKSSNDNIVKNVTDIYNNFDKNK